MNNHYTKMLSELSDKTMASYKKKATTDLYDTTPEYNKNPTRKLGHRFWKRSDGLDRQYRLTKKKEEQKK